MVVLGLSLKEELLLLEGFPRAKDCLGIATSMTAGSLLELYL